MDGKWYTHITSASLSLIFVPEHVKNFCLTLLEWKISWPIVWISSSSEDLTKSKLHLCQKSQQINTRLGTMFVKFVLYVCILPCPNIVSISYSLSSGRRTWIESNRLGICIVFKNPIIITRILQTIQLWQVLHKVGLDFPNFLCSYLFHILINWFIFGCAGSGCTQAFSSCIEWGLLSIVMPGLLLQWLLLLWNTGSRVCELPWLWHVGSRAWAQ